MIKFLLCFCLFFINLNYCFANENWPNKPITIVIPSAPGGGQDIAARLLINKLQNKLTQPVIIFNKPGANNTIGSQYVAESNPDGYTILITSSTIITNEIENNKINLLKKLSPITVFLKTPLILTVSKKYKNFEEFIKYGQQNELLYGTINVSATANKPIENLIEKYHIKARNIPFNSVTQILNEIVAERIDFTFAAQNIVEENENYITYKDINIDFWFGVFVPVNTPKPIITQMYNIFNKTINDDEFKKSLCNSCGKIINNMTPEKFNILISKSIESKNLEPMGDN